MGKFPFLLTNLFSQSSYIIGVVIVSIGEAISARVSPSLPTFATNSSTSSSTKRTMISISLGLSHVITATNLSC